MNKFRLLISTSFASLLSFSAIAQEADTAPIPASEPDIARKQIMVVLDASGSMWGKVGDKTKMEIVRHAYGKLVMDWEKQPIDAGLIVYGHRRKGDCSDIELIAKPGKSDGFSLSRSVDHLIPKGKTPLGAAVRMAAEKLKYTENKATVILLSDGKETCGIDPCQLGLDLEAQGIDFTTHVIGLDIDTGKTRQQLQCLAENTGGRYMSADNAAQLGKAFEQASTDAEPIKGDEHQSAGLEQGLVIWALLSDTGEPAMRTQWRLSGQGEVYEFKDHNSKLDLTKMESTELGPGEYTIEAFSGDYAGAANFTLPTDKETIYLHLQRDIAAITMEIKGDIREANAVKVDWTGAGGKDDRIAVVKSGAGFDHLALASASVSKGNPLTLIAPSKAGDYDLVYVHDAFGLQRIDQRDPIKVLTQNYSLTPVGPVRAGEKFDVKWEGPGAEPQKIAIAPLNSGIYGSTSLRWVTAGNPLTLKAPDTSGEYELRYYTGSNEILFTAPVTVE